MQRDFFTAEEFLVCSADSLRKGASGVVVDLAWGAMDAEARPLVGFDKFTICKRSSAHLSS